MAGVSSRETVIGNCGNKKQFSTLKERYKKKTKYKNVLHLRPFGMESKFVHFNLTNCIALVNVIAQYHCTWLHLQKSLSCMSTEILQGYLGTWHQVFPDCSCAVKRFYIHLYLKPNAEKCDFPFALANSEKAGEQARNQIFKTALVFKFQSANKKAFVIPIYYHYLFFLELPVHDFPFPVNPALQ